MITLRQMSELTTLYTQPHRKYHNINHINDCLVELVDVCLRFNYLNSREHMIVKHAIWYHDVVYNSYSKTNEADSAGLIEYGFEFDMAAALDTQAIVLATAKHLVTQENISLATQVMLDIDLSGFGKDRMIFAMNGMNIRHEYYNTTIKDFLKGRMTFYEALVKRPTLYYTEYFYNKYHEMSRKNIEWEMVLLGAALTNDNPKIWCDKMEAATEGY